jgi:hypothetical protein
MPVKAGINLWKCFPGQERRNGNASHGWNIFSGITVCGGNCKCFSRLEVAGIRIKITRNPGEQLSGSKGSMAGPLKIAMNTKGRPPRGCHYSMETHPSGGEKSKGMRPRAASNSWAYLSRPHKSHAATMQGHKKMGGMLLKLAKKLRECYSGLPEVHKNAFQIHKSREGNAAQDWNQRLGMPLWADLRG